MRFIHAADIHLGSKCDAKFPREISEERKREIRESFSKLIDYAEDNNIKVILLAGDVFDRDHPSTKDKDFFFSACKLHPDISFYYLRGNHDKADILESSPSNLYFFGEKWQSYDLGENVKVYGIELSEKNSKGYYDSLKLDLNDFNIVMCHGQVSPTVGPETIVLKNLKNKGIDYLALGHIHSRQEGTIDDRGSFAYSGCLCGRGFDEIGEKGFVVYDTDTRKSDFVSVSKRRLIEVDVDVSQSTDNYSAFKAITNKCPPDRTNIYRFNLVGEIGGDVDLNEEDIASFLKDSKAYYFANVKNKTTRKCEYGKYKDEVSLKGEFVRKVMAANDLSEDEKNDIIALGLKALLGKDID